LQQHALAGSTASQNRKRGALFDLEAEPAQDILLAEGLLQILDGDRQIVLHDTYPIGQILSISFTSTTSERITSTDARTTWLGAARLTAAVALRAWRP